MVLVLGKEPNTVGTVGGILAFVQIIPMIGTIIPTENALKKKFDKFGRRR